MKYLIAAAALVIIFAGCGSASYRDGEYSALSGKDERGAYAEVTLTIRGGKVTDCVFLTWQKDGSVKDEDYGKVNGEISNRDFYAKAQLAVRAMEQYRKEYMDSGSLDGVNAVSGATNSYNQFLEAVEKALEDAKM
ncbi:MAG: FMN-binding protein [Spirochaetales bacterium]|jgi:major membrane immunogen (membrane-anchored lipoprotein)|nr:FMN-binding protein [Spirochaetales bacterium]